MTYRPKLYLASRFEQAPVLRKTRDEELVPRGYEVTSRWLDQEERIDSPEAGTFDRHRRLERAYNDLRDIDRADIVILDATFDPEGYATYGAFFEAGFTCGRGGKRLILIGDNASVFFELPFVTRAKDWVEAIRILEAEREGATRLEFEPVPA